MTLKRWIPPSVILTSMRVLPASIAFSTSSLTTPIGLSTTSPAAIIFAVNVSNCLIFPIFFTCVYYTIMIYERGYHASKK